MHWYERRGRIIIRHFTCGEYVCPENMCAPFVRANCVIPNVSLPHFGCNNIDNDLICGGGDVGDWLVGRCCQRLRRCVGIDVCLSACFVVCVYAHVCVLCALADYDP